MAAPFVDTFHSPPTRVDAGGNMPSAVAEICVDLPFHRRRGSRADRVILREIAFVWANPQEVAEEAWTFTATPEQQGGHIRTTVASAVAPGHGRRTARRKSRR
jgi:hypothetical protein